MVKPAIDSLGRNTGKSIEIGGSMIAEEKISYVKFGDHATNLPATMRFATNGVFKESMQYKYDSMGNIVEVLENGRSACRYEYDALGRLTREDNVAFAKTTTWAYDNNGNIIAKYEYAITTKPTDELHLLNGTCKLYTYDDNSDQLTSYNGEAFVYDQIGNPTTYRGKTAVWEYGRQLKSYDGNTFSYDASGRRTAKNDITFTYDSNGNLIKQSNGLEFFYDHTGVFAVKYGTETYYYRKDALGNIVKLLDKTGAVVVKYKYTAWGKCEIDTSTTKTTLAGINPFRYRGYYFDTETGLYFLKTRYYDPEIGRFMTIDDIAYLSPKHINGLNLYAYCRNNPVAGYDPCGTWDWGTFWDVALTVGAIIAGVAIGIAVGAVAGVLVGILAGVATFGFVNNTVNFVYYTFISDGVSDLTPTSYHDGYINRWERLDYAKQETKQSWYNFNAWMYNSEYTFHAHVWWLTGWSHGDGVPVFSWLASKAEKADIAANDPLADFDDKKDLEGVLRILAYLAWGLLGL